jgi:RNA polymerase-binding transcription factor
MPVDMTHFKERLIKERDGIKTVANASAGDRKPVELDQARLGRLSRMDAMQGQAMSEAIAARRITELKRIETALKRIDEGDYGYCISCGDKIALKRLELDPTAPICTDCAQERTH